MKSEIAWMAGLDAAKAAANAMKRPLFIDFWDDDCNGCQALESETYADPRVAALLGEHFVALKINTSDAPELARQFSIFWTPALVTLHHHGHRLRETIGYLAPDEMCAELTVTRGLHALRSARAAEAEAHFRSVIDEFASSHTAPEALYWQGLAAYRRGKDKADLWVAWRELAAAYPESIWAMKTTLQQPALT